MATTLTFDVTALDNASKAFARMGAAVERFERKLDKLDNKDVDPEIDVDVDRPIAKVNRAGGAMSDIMRGAAKIVTAHAGIMAVAVAAAIAASPAVAAVAAAGIVAAMGGAFAAIGIAAAAQSKRVKKEFADLKNDVVKRVKEMAAPFEPMLLHVADVARNVFDSFAPALEKSFAKLAPTLTVFTDDLAAAFEQLKPAIAPITDAFTAIIRQLGPMLKPLFKDIGKSLTQLAGVVEDNAHIFAAFIAGVARLIPIAITVTAKLAGFFAVVIRNAPVMAATFLAGVRTMIQGVQTFMNRTLDAIAFVLRGFALMPGPIGAASRSAVNKLAGFRRGANETFNAAIDKIHEWETNLRAMPKEVRLRGHIRDLQQKIEAAKAKIKTVPKSKRSDIRGRIADLRAAVREAKAQLNSIQDETVNIIVRRQTFDLPGTSQSRRLMQHGGRALRGEALIVGEVGPELFVPDHPGRVVPNNQLRQAGAGELAGGVNVTIEHVELRDGVDVDLLGARLGFQLRAGAL